VRVSVRLNGPLATLLGPRRDVALPDGATVADLLAALAAEAGADAVPGLAVAIAGAIVEPSHGLGDGDQVAVLAPVAGG
jgi:sulfur carrier protein ThiS